MRLVCPHTKVKAFLFHFHTDLFSSARPCHTHFFLSFSWLFGPLFSPKKKPSIASHCNSFQCVETRTPLIHSLTLHLLSFFLLATHSNVHSYECGSTIEAA